MVRKIMPTDRGNPLKKIKNIKQVMKRSNLPKPKPDSFEKQTPKLDDMSNIEFRFQKLKFSADAEARMEKMSTKEKIAYIRQLKKEGKYTIENPNQ